MAISDLLSSDPVSAFRSKINDILDVVNIAARDISGTLAGRPAANSVEEGTYYFATDTAVAYRSDGSTWSVVGVRPAGTIGGSELVDESVDTAQLADAAVTDAKLASPNNAVYRTLLNQSGYAEAFLPAATYILGTSGSGGLPVASGSDIMATQPVAAGFMPIYFDNDDFAVAGKTQKLRLRVQVGTNSVAWSSVTATFGLYPFTPAGGNNVFAPTLGTVVTGSTVAFVNPGANTLHNANSGDFTIPSDGQYCIGFVLSATLTTNATAILSAQLQTRHVD